MTRPFRTTESESLGVQHRTSRSYRELCRFDPSRNQGSGTRRYQGLASRRCWHHVVPEMQGQAELLAAVDASLSDLMRNLLHHPDFQSMEGLWRSLDLLLHRLELDGELEVVLYDLARQSLRPTSLIVKTCRTRGSIIGLSKRHRSMQPKWPPP